MLYSRPSGCRIARSYVSLESKGKGTEGVLYLLLFLRARQAGARAGRGQRAQLLSGRGRWRVCAVQRRAPLRWAQLASGRRGAAARMRGGAGGGTPGGTTQTARTCPTSR